MSNDNNNKQMNPVVRYALIAILGVVAIAVAREIYNVIDPPVVREMRRSTQELQEFYCKQDPTKCK